MGDLPQVSSKHVHKTGSVGAPAAPQLFAVATANCLQCQASSQGAAALTGLAAKDLDKSSGARAPVALREETKHQDLFPAVEAKCPGC